MTAQLKTPNDWFAAGRIMACQRMPYFSAAVMGLVPYPHEGYGTLGVSARGVLVWDPELFKTWTVENLAWVLIHEAGHYLRDHAGRCKMAAAEPLPWNIAGDAEINDDLISAGALFPVLTAKDGVDADQIGKPSGVTPALIGCENGRLCEEYYAHLRKNAQQIPGGVLQLQSAGKGTGKGKKGVTPPKLMPLTGKGHGCGSGAGGDPNEVELGIPAEMGKSAAEQKRIQREVAQAIQKHASKGRGNVPAGLARWADEVLGPPHIPWQQKLARLCRSAIAYRSGIGDYRYDRPSRRQGAFGYGTGSPVFPALRQPIPQVAVIADTSGSMGEAELRAGLEETKGILLAVGAHIDFFACDAEVHSAVKVRSIQEVCKALKGGGGTDMRPAFEALMHRARRPEVVVCVTDGQIGDPGPRPHGVHVIWLVVGECRRVTFPWGDVIEIPETV